jgi:hypothetical protein
MECHSLKSQLPSPTIKITGLSVLIFSGWLAAGRELKMISDVLNVFNFGA